MLGFSCTGDPETNIFAPGNGWLEYVGSYEAGSFWGKFRPIFRGELLLVSGSERVFWFQTVPTGPA